MYWRKNLTTDDREAAKLILYDVNYRVGDHTTDISNLKHSKNPI